MILQKLLNKQELSEAEIKKTLKEIITHKNVEKNTSFLRLLRQKTETASELKAFIDFFRAQMIPISIEEDVLDIVGTGGDQKNTVNISSAQAIAASSVGVKVLKHGNRSASSLSGSADVMESMGIDIHMKEQKLIRSIDQVGIGFAFAPNFHPALKEVKDLRKMIGSATTFNLIGPLLNPASPSFMMIGVYDESLLELFANTLKEMKVKRAFVFHGAEGLDEITTLGPSKVFEITDNKIHSFILDPKDFGFEYGKLQDLQGFSPEENGKKIQEALQGKEGALRDTLILGAGCALYVSEKVKTIQEGVDVARKNIGKAKDVLDKWIQFSQKDILSELIENKKLEVQALKDSITSDDPIHALLEGKKKRVSDKSFLKNVSQKGVSVIGEIKRKSPTKKEIKNDLDAVGLAQKYVQGGASAISVLTDKRGFNGSIQDLKEISTKVKNIPLLRKDFIIDPIQIAEAVVHGADAVLLIVSILKERTQEFLKVAKKMNIDALVEVHDEKDLEIAIDAGAEIIGINNRNLKTFEIDLNTSINLFEKLPSHVVSVSESGIRDSKDIALLKNKGFDAVLIGEALVKKANPEKFIQGVKSAY